MTKRKHTVFAYVIEGRGNFYPETDASGHNAQGRAGIDRPGGGAAGDESLILFKDGDRISDSTKAEPVRFLLISGKPLNEPIAWQGPIVMNTQAELQLAFEEYRQGRFVKHVQR